MYVFPPMYIRVAVKGQTGRHAQARRNSHGPARSLLFRLSALMVTHSLYSISYIPYQLIYILFNSILTTISSLFTISFPFLFISRFTLFLFSFLFLSFFILFFSPALTHPLCDISRCCAVGRRHPHGGIEAPHGHAPSTAREQAASSSGSDGQIQLL